jgi:hypothetical protein
VTAVKEMHAPPLIRQIGRGQPTLGAVGIGRGNFDVDSP